MNAAEFEALINKDGSTLASPNKVKLNKCVTLERDVLSKNFVELDLN